MCWEAVATAASLAVERGYVDVVKCAASLHHAQPHCASTGQMVGGVVWVEVSRVVMAVAFGGLQHLICSSSLC